MPGLLEELVLDGSPPRERRDRIRATGEGIMERKYTLVIEKRGRWYVAYAEELPGVRAQGRSAAEARQSLDEALERGPKANREFAARSKHRGARRKTKPRR
jgi:predicted RNase H-like HicB family nuclease